MTPFEEVIDTPDKAVETVGAAMDRLRQLAYRVPPDEDGHGAVTWQEEREQLYALLAEVGMLLNAIRARDGAPYHDAWSVSALGSHDRANTYMHPDSFDNLVERISEVLGGDILKAAWDTRERGRP